MNEENTEELWIPVWSEKYLSGNTQLDHFHKVIVEGIEQLYTMSENAQQYKQEIPELTAHLEAALWEHMDLEIFYLKKYDIPYTLHEASHDKFKSTLVFYKDYKMNPVIRAILTAETASEYMKKHFFHFDVYDIPKINEKMKIDNEK